MRHLIFCLLLAGCGAYRAAVNADINYSIGVTPLGTATQRPAVGAESVAVYLSPAQIPGRYEEVALLTTHYDPTQSRAALALLRKRAGERGANALLLLPPGGPTSASTSVDWVGNVKTSISSQSRTVAIYVTR